VGKGALTLLYHSPDFVHWEFVHPLYNATEWLGGDMFECPDFYPINGTVHVYKTSVGAVGTRFDMWMVGEWNLQSQEFVPYFNKQGWYDFGIFYASKSFYDPAGMRQIVFGWATEDDSQASFVARGWAGVQTLPRQVMLNEDYTISQFPIAEVAVLQGAHYGFPNLLVSDQEIPLNITKGDQLQINMQIDSVEGTPYKFGLKIRASPDNTEYTQIYFRPPIPYLENNDLPGNDFVGIPLNASDPGLCSELCTANAQCFCWAYAPPGDQGPSAMCFLKRLIPTFSPKIGTVSGVKALLEVDRTYSSLASDANKNPQIAPLSSPPETVQVFIDHSMVEIYVNGGRTNLVSRIYPTLPASQLVSVFVEGGTVKMSLDVWEMNSIWAPQ